MEPLKKCIVLDLDNTLWGGVIGEDGVKNIQLSLEESGAPFLAFQQALRDLYDRGVLLAINSHNNEADAMEAIRTHPNMILKENHFAAKRLGWGDKVEAMRELSKELNIGLDSMVFLDDSPLQREAVKSALPEVAVPQMPEDPREYTRMLLSLPYFSSNTLTDEDLMRGNMYVTERLRRESEKRFENREAFLESLGLQLNIAKNDTSALARLSQLTEKTNQFNTNKIPQTESEMRELMESSDHEVFHAHAVDRFGDHGIIALAIVDRGNEVWTIRTMLMSCRVFERGLEDALLSAIADEAKAEGAKDLRLQVTPTDKNEPARIFAEKWFAGGSMEVARAQKPSWITLKIL